MDNCGECRLVGVDESAEAREMDFEELLDRACDSANLPEMARLLLPSTLSAETKNMVLKLTPEEFGRILASAIDQINRGSVETVDGAGEKGFTGLKKRLGWILFIAYVLFLLWLTILFRQPRVGERVFKWELLWYIPYEVIAYQITSVRDSIFLPESRDYICPTCKKGRLRYRDHCRRIVRHEGGEAEWFFIPRSRCDNHGCRRLHRMLPDFMVKFKHYSAEVISGVLDGVVTPEDADSEDRPSVDTMNRWHHWLMANEQYINGTLKSVGFRDLGFGEELLRSGISLLRELRRSSERWLETINSFIYNSGGFLVPV